MSDSTVILNARLPQRVGLYQIAIQAGKIARVERSDQHFVPPSVEENAVLLDVEGDWITLGALDLQINGALGLAFPDLRLDNIDKLQKICDFLWQQGVSAFCPTLVTTSIENFQGSLAAIQSFQQSQSGLDTAKVGTAQIVGAHLEGPFLNNAKRGAHPSEYLQPLTLGTVKAVIGEFVSAIRIMTLAPEEATEEVISWLCAQGITVSLGHSLATAEQATQAFDQGATMVTHAFNAMPGLHHRKPGLLGAALTDDRVFCGFIADGQHICPTMLDLLLRIGRGSTASAMDGLFLVSDALSPLGLPDGKYPWDTREIEVISGTARLPDGTLSGTTLPLIDGALNLVKWGLCEMDEAISLVTDAPRKAINMPVLQPGLPDRLIRWHQKSPKHLTWEHLRLSESILPA